MRVRLFCLATWCVLGLLVVGCGKNGESDPRATTQATLSATQLRTDAAAVCNPRAAVILEAASTESVYRLNRVPYDSAGLVEALASARLNERGATVVQMKVDSSRSRDVVWLVDAVKRAGAEAFIPDSQCVQSIPAEKAAT